MHHNKLAPNNHNTKRNTSLRNRVLRFAAGTALTGVLVGSAGCSSSNEAAPQVAKTTATTEATARPQATAEAQLKMAEKQAAAKLQQHATKAASSVLSILANPKAGTENFSQHSLSNKAAILGPDGRTKTADDAKYRNFPESNAQYYPGTGYIRIRAAKSAAVAGNDNAYWGNATFWSVDMLFKVDSDNPITKENDQLTVADFNTALSDADSITLVAMSGLDGAEKDANGQELGSRAGIWISEAGLIPDDGSLVVYNAAAGRQPNTGDVLTDPGTIAHQADNLATIVDAAAGRLLAYSQR